jgi:hypothetical protein
MQALYLCRNLINAPIRDQWIAPTETVRDSWTEMGTDRAVEPRETAEMTLKL